MHKKEVLKNNLKAIKIPIILKSLKTTIAR